MTSVSESHNWKSKENMDNQPQQCAPCESPSHTRDDDLHAHYAASPIPSSTSYSFSGADLAAARESCSAIPLSAPTVPPQSSTSSPISSGDAATGESSFDCNICLEVPSDPVITRCGHLFCWKCLYTWMQSGKCECPVCKAFVAPDNVIPLYGKGRNNGNHSYHHTRAQNCTNSSSPAPGDSRANSSSTPPRPRAARTEAPRSESPSWASSFQSFFDSSNWSASPFGASMGLGSGALTFGAGLGFFPSLFGLSFTYAPQNTQRASQQHQHRNGSTNRPQSQQQRPRPPNESVDDINDAAFSRLIMFLAILLFFSVLFY